MLMNPPFGTRQKGADIVFLAAACAVASRAVYSLHKARLGELGHKHAPAETR